MAQIWASSMLQTLGSLDVPAWPVVLQHTPWMRGCQGTMDTRATHGGSAEAAPSSTMPHLVAAAREASALASGSSSLAQYARCALRTCSRRRGSNQVRASALPSKPCSRQAGTKQAQHT